MFKRIFFIVLVLISTSVVAFSQVQNRIYLKGIDGNEIKLSQLTDTSIKLITTIDLPLNHNTVTIYLTDLGYPPTIVVQLAVSSGTGGYPLIYFKDKLRVGASIIIEDLKIKNPKTGAEILLKGSRYKIIAS
ncbi:hypothetical protein [Ferruginibacter sp.]|nr:hypothetical protein [Ferruginibacter sp.]